MSVVYQRAKNSLVAVTNSWLGIPLKLQKNNTFNPCSNFNNRKDNLIFLLFLICNQFIEFQWYYYFFSFHLTNIHTYSITFRNSNNNKLSIAIDEQNHVTLVLIWEQILIVVMLVAKENQIQQQHVQVLFYILEAIHPNIFVVLNVRAQFNFVTCLH